MNMFSSNRLIAAMICFFVSQAIPVYAYEALQGPTETRYWDAERAYNGYTLFGARGGTYLIDMAGRVVKTWSSVRTNPRFLENGNILDSSTDDPSRGGGFVEVDWDDNVVWRYMETRPDYAPHHDFIRIFNKKLGAYTTLYIANKSITHEQAIAAGCDPGRNYNGVQMDAIVEVDMDGNIIWEWWFFDHVVQDVDPEKDNYYRISEIVRLCKDFRAGSPIMVMARNSKELGYDSKEVLLCRSPLHRHYRYVREIEKGWRRWYAQTHLGPASGLPGPDCPPLCRWTASPGNQTSPAHLRRHRHLLAKTL